MPAPTIDMFLTSLEKERLDNYTKELKRLSDLWATSLLWVKAYKVGLGLFKYGTGTTVISPINGDRLGYSGDDLELIEWNIAEWSKRADASKLDFDKLQAESNRFLDELIERYGDQLNSAIASYVSSNNMQKPIEETTSVKPEVKPEQKSPEQEKKDKMMQFGIIGAVVLVLILLFRK